MYCVLRIVSTLLLDARARVNGMQYEQPWTAMDRYGRLRRRASSRQRQASAAHDHWCVSSIPCANPFSLGHLPNSALLLWACFRLPLGPRTRRLHLRIPDVCLCGRERTRVSRPWLKLIMSPECISRDPSSVPNCRVCVFLSARGIGVASRNGCRWSSLGKRDVSQNPNCFV